MAKKTAMSGSAKTAGVVGGIAAIAAAAAGAYYLYGSKEAVANRKAMKSWMLKVKADVMDEIEQLKDVNEDAYRSAIDKVSKKYKDIKGMDKAELAALVTRLHSHWRDVKAEIATAGKDAVHTARKTAKATVKKAKK